MRIVNLPWYDFHELTRATDALWSGFERHMARAGIAEIPKCLDRATDHACQWRQPDLLLSQACGYDVLYDSASDLTVVATPCFTADGCEGSCYRSAVVVRADDPIATLEDLRGRVCVINEPSSHSGTNALRPLFAPLSRGGRFFRDVVVSGDHTVSLEMLASRLADVACIDVVVWELCRRVRPQALEGMRVLCLTEKAPAPPYVTSRQTSPDLRDRLRSALLSAMDDPHLRSVRDDLLVGGVEVLDEGAYQSLVGFEAPALERDYFELPAPRLSPLSLLPGAVAGSALAGGHRRSGCGSR